MWQIILGFLAVGYCIYLVNERVRKLEGVRGPSYSLGLFIDARNAITKHKRFGELAGIKSASEGKDYKDWTKEDKTKLSQHRRTVLDKTRISISYLQGENAYFIKTFDDVSSLVRRDGADTTNLLYDHIVAGDQEEVDSYLSFSVYERLMKDSDGEYRQKIVPCLTYHHEDLDKKDEFESLCEFPLFQENMSNKQLERLGFQVKESDGGDVYEDSFGDSHSVPTVTTLEKNGVEIRYV